MKRMNKKIILKNDIKNNQNYMDKKVWRCRTKLNNHDIKKI